MIELGPPLGKRDECKIFRGDAKLVSISEQVAKNSDDIAELREQMTAYQGLLENVELLNRKVSALELDVKILKKAIG